MDRLLIDSSSEASYMNSYQALTDGLSIKERTRLLVALYKVEAAARASHPTPLDGEEFMRVSRESVHGLGYTEILDRADRLTSDSERKLAAIEEKGQTTYESLSGPEQVWFTVTRLLFCIRDGGLCSYFYNGYSEHLVDCLRSLEILGATEMHEMVRTMNTIDWTRRPGFFTVLREWLRAWSGSAARESERELEQARLVEEKLSEYITRHRLA